MMDEIGNETLIERLRSELRKDDIKLWKEPYTDNDGNGTDHIETLASNYCVKLNSEKEGVLNGLEHLRIFALERLQQNAKFKQENIATLRLKFSPKSVSMDDLATIQTKLDISGRELTSMLSEKLKVEPGQIKLVYSGKIIQPNVPLNALGVCHNKTIMCMVFSSDNKHQTEQAEKKMSEVRKARRGAELLASSNSASAQAYDAQITDQNGRTLDIPNHEKSSLMIALGLHEKGRGSLKKKKYSLALLYLLEADEEFRQCRAEILNLVDNFAVLCLDISWCYLCLQNLDALPDVSDRLKTCERVFKKSYGESLQRLMAIKGSSGHEVALFVRLYVLQGIVAYHEGNYTLSRDLLAKAKSYASTVEVDEAKILEMVTLGFTVTEARLSLRTCNGNTSSAINDAFQKREEKEKILKDEKEKSRKRKLAHRLGACANGEEVNIDLYEKMVNELGLEADISAEALKQSNNNITNAIELVHDNPDLLRQKGKCVTDAKIQQLEAIGFDRTSAKVALTHFGGMVEKTIEYLSMNSGICPPEWLEEIQTNLENRPSSSKDLSTDDKEAMKKIAKVVDRGEDYLDISLNEETEYITLYLAKLNSVLS